MKACPQCGVVAPSDLESCRIDQSGLREISPGGTTLDGKYVLERLLGEGGMGLVFLGRHLALDRPFAIKLVRSHGQAWERFRREAEALGRLKNRNIVDVTDYGIDREQEVPYLVMEYLEGESLRSVLDRRSRLPLSEAIPILRQIADGLDHAHEQGVLHRDLKPENVMIVKGEEGPTVKLVDFGIAAEVGAESTSSDPVHVGTDSEETWIPGTGEISLEGRLTEEGVVIGTIPYMSPEVLDGRSASPASDRYSFALLCYEVLVGGRPFRGSGHGLIHAITSGPLPMPSGINSELPPSVDTVLARGLSRDVGRRPDRAGILVDDLAASWASESSRRWRRKAYPIRILAALLMTLTLTLAARVPPISTLVRAIDGFLYDTAMSVRPEVAGDTRIVLVLIDEMSLERDPTPLASRSEEVADAIETLLGRGAAGVVVDLILPSAWQKSQRFNEVILGSKGSLVMAAYGSGDGQQIGPEALHPITRMLLGSDLEHLFAPANMPPDPDGVVRRARSWFRTPDGSIEPTLAAEAAELLGGRFEGEGVWVDYAIRAEDYPRVPFQNVPTSSTRFDGKLVLIGASFEASGDEFWTPVGDTISGVELQALTVDSMLRTEKIERIDMVATGILTGSLGLGIVVLMLLPRSVVPALLLLGGVIVGVGLASHVALARESVWLEPGRLLATVAISGVLGASVRLFLKPEGSP